MKTVYKYELAVTEEQICVMPIGAKILSIQTQNEQICLWALVDTEQKEFEARGIVIKGTGYNLSEYEHLEYIGTGQMAEGNFVYHCFENKL